VNVLAEELGGRVLAVELRNLVEVLEVHDAQDLLQRVLRGSKVDDQAVLVELVGDEDRLDLVRDDVHELGGAEDLALERVRTFQVVADRQREHGNDLPAG
jgi:hypothetical protein